MNRPTVHGNHPTVYGGDENPGLEFARSLGIDTTKWNIREISVDKDRILFKVNNPDMKVCDRTEIDGLPMTGFVTEFAIPTPLREPAWEEPSDEFIAAD